MPRKLSLLFIVLALLLGACGPQAINAPEAAPPVEEIDAVEAAPAEFEEPTAEVAAEPEMETLTFTDDLDRTIELDGYPQAIVALSPSITESLFAIGAGGQVVGRDEYSLFPEAALEIPSVGSMWGGVPAEAILALEPDLVIVAQIVAEENVTALEDLGLTVYWMANPADFDGLYHNLQTLAEITGHVEKSETLVASLAARVAAVETTVSQATGSPSVFYELDASDPSNPWTTGSGTFIDYVIQLAGGTNAAAELEGDYAQISSEALIAINPEVILLADALYGIAPESLVERSGWDAIAAVQNGEVHPFDPGLLSIPGPRMVDGLEIIAQTLNPELFE